MNYDPLPVLTDLSQYALGEAALFVGPSFIYELHVNPYLQFEARMLLKRLAADMVEHPMAPLVNLELDGRLARREWVLCANGHACGSPGVEV